MVFGLGFLVLRTNFRSRVLGRRVLSFFGGRNGLDLGKAEYFEPAGPSR